MPSLNSKKLGENWFKDSNSLRRIMCISQSTYLKEAELLNSYSAVWPRNPGEKKDIYQCVYRFIMTIQTILTTHIHTLNFCNKIICNYGKVKFSTVK